MSTKGTLTFIGTNYFGEKRPIKRKVFWMDGYDAWLAIFATYGEKDKRTSKPTSYRFTCDTKAKVIKLSKGSNDEFAVERVKERTMNLHRFFAGELINKGYTLTWLDSTETKECLAYYAAKREEYKQARISS